MSIIPHGGVAPASPVKYDPLSRTLHWIFAAIIIYTMIEGISLHIITNHALLHFVSTLNMSLASCLFVLFPIRYLWTFFRSEPAEIESIPAMPENCRSSGVATDAAIVSGFAPGKLALTLMVG